MVECEPEFVVHLIARQIDRVHLVHGLRGVAFVSVSPCRGLPGALDFAFQRKKAKSYCESNVRFPAEFASKYDTGSKHRHLRHFHHLVSDFPIQTSCFWSDAN